jgi:hypothetical protein
MTDVQRRRFIAMLAGAHDRSIDDAARQAVDIPPVAGGLSFDIRSREAAAADYGGHIARLRSAVLEPGSEQDIVRLVQTGNRKSVPIAMRGRGCSTSGQSQVDDGRLTEMAGDTRFRKEPLPAPRVPAADRRDCGLASISIDGPHRSRVRRRATIRAPISPCSCRADEPPHTRFGFRRAAAKDCDDHRGMLAANDLLVERALAAGRYRLSTVRADPFDGAMAAALRREDVVALRRLERAVRSEERADAGRGCFLDARAHDRGMISGRRQGCDSDSLRLRLERWCRDWLVMAAPRRR